MVCLTFSRSLLTIQTLFWLQLQTYSTAASRPHIAVIGGGIGGATACYYLSELFGSSGAKIDIYEARRVGGRLAVVDIGGRNYEAGGSIIHKRNRYMNNFAEKLGLKHSHSPGGRLGLYDGNSYAFKESNFWLWTYAELLMRYGMSMFRWDNLMNHMLDDFDRIYEHQDKGLSFTTVEKLLAAMSPNFVNLTQETTEYVLDALQFSDKFIKELGLAVTRVNYGQTTQINGLVGSISLAAAQPALWSVEKGNYQLADGAITLAKATLLYARVNNIYLNYNGKYELEIGEEDVDSNNTAIYDIVVIASPQTSDQATITFKGFPENTSHFSGHYHQTIATFVQGKLNYSYFGFNDESDAVEDIVTINTSMLYNSVSRNFPVDWSEEDDKDLLPVYKIFSQEDLSEIILDEMFETRTVTKAIDWLAYPHYTPPEALGSFQLHDRLYYTSAIEWAGSAMEMSAIAGRNVALLAYNQWNGSTHMVDGIKDSESKDEL